MMDAVHRYSASVPYGKATPYFPVIDLLKRYSHVEERDDTRTIRAKVTGPLCLLSCSCTGVGTASSARWNVGSWRAIRGVITPAPGV